MKKRRKDTSAASIPEYQKKKQISADLKGQTTGDGARELLEIGGKRKRGGNV